VSGRNIGQRPVLLSGQDAWGLGLDVRAACVCGRGVNGEAAAGRTVHLAAPTQPREWLDHLNPFGGGPTAKSAGGR
jgi:hypothetical protein